MILFEWINDRDLVLFNTRNRLVHETNHQFWINLIANRSDLVIFAIRAVKDQRQIVTCHLSNIKPVHYSTEL